MSYDALFILAILILALLPAPAIDTELRLSFWGTWATRAYLLSIWFGYFIYFWHCKGSSPGMWIWRLEITDEQGARPGVMRLGLRIAIAFFSFGCALIGYLWLYVTGTTWHERLTRTRTVLITRPTRG